MIATIIIVILIAIRIMVTIITAGVASIILRRDLSKMRKTREAAQE
jgi:hypothetical protein